MDKKQLNALLVSALMAYQACGNGLAIRKVAENLASKSFYDELKVTGENRYERCLDFLSKLWHHNRDSCGRGHNHRPCQERSRKYESYRSCYNRYR